MEKQIQSFIDHCKMEKRLSDKTIKAYTIDLNQFRAVLKSKDIRGVNKIDIRNFFLNFSKHSPRTIKRKIATLKVFFSYLEQDNELLSNPFHRMKVRIKLDSPIPKIATILQIQDILKLAYSNIDDVLDVNSTKYREGIRDVAILELFCATGIRVSELCSIKIENISDDFKSILIRGKGNKERRIPITNSATQKALRDNFEANKNDIVNTSFFFTNRRRKRISEQSVRFMVKNFSVKAKVKGGITPHVFRHSFATQLLEEDIDIRYIQHFLGHSSIAVTQIYTHVNEKKKEELLSLKNPRNFMMI